MDKYVFALKLYLAAALAYYVAAHLAFPQSYWAVVTCCAVMNPLSGAIRSKAMYRAAGTVMAGICALLLASATADVPVLFLGTAGVLAVFGFGVAVLDRTPRAYGFQLFAVTLLLIVASGIDQPQTLFDTAVARICEIGVGLISCTVIDSIIAPRSLKPVVQGRMRNWLKDMQGWMEDVFTTETSGAVSQYDRHRIIADITTMSALAGQLRFDPFMRPKERRAVFAIQHRVLRMVPMLASVDSYAAAWPNDQRAALGDWKRVAVAHVRDGSPASAALRGLGNQPSDAGLDTPWHRLIRRNFSDLIVDILDLWAEIRSIAAYLEDGKPMRDALAKQVWAARPFPLWPDFEMAVRVALGLLLAYAVICALWWATAWNNGASALILGMVALAFFGSVDNAERVIASFLRFAAMGLLLGGLLAYGVLPLVHSIETLLLVLALVMLPIGMWALSQPRALLMLALAFGNCGLQATFAPKDFATYLGTCIASLLGIYLGQVCVGLVRDTDPARARERLMQQERRDVQALARADRSFSRDFYMSRSLDRMTGIISRSQSGDDRTKRLLSALRGGVAISIVRDASPQVRGELRRACDAMLAAVRQAQGPIRTPALRTYIDQALSAAWVGQAPRTLIRGLVGMRLAWYGDAPSWTPSEGVH